MTVQSLCVCVCAYECVCVFVCICKRMGWEDEAFLMEGGGRDSAVCVCVCVCVHAPHASGLCCCLCHSSCPTTSLKYVCGTDIQNVSCHQLHACASEVSVIVCVCVRVCVRVCVWGGGWVRACVCARGVVCVCVCVLRAGRGDAGAHFPCTGGVWLVCECGCA